MNLIVEVLLSRQSGVYLSGEPIECRIVFTNNCKDRQYVEQIGWASCQLHCQQILSSQRIKVCIKDTTTTTTTTMFSAQSPSVNSTSLNTQQESGTCIYSSKPKILFCDLKLFGSQTLSFEFSDSFPDNLPPSFKGHAMKILYKLTVAAQRPQMPVKLIRIPLKLLVLQGVSTLGQDQNYFTPTNPFLEQSINKIAFLDLAQQLIDVITSQRDCHVYNITNDKGRVCRLTLFKTCYKLGDQIVGLIDFTNCLVPCVQLCVSLQTEEVVNDDWKIQRSTNRPTPSSITTYNRQHLFTVSCAESQLAIQVPLHATPSFFTDIVQLRWKLHFEFVCGEVKEKQEKVPVKDWSAPKQINVNTMVWDLPIKVYPCSPVNAALASPTPQYKVIF